LVGVAPYASRATRSMGRRCIWGGRTNVRQVLYMAAMSASIGILGSRRSMTDFRPPERSRRL
jgi:hypothetical protein